MNQRFDTGQAVQSVLFGGGLMGEALRALDWSRTALGPVHGWPQSLRTVVRVLLDSRYAMWLAWGPELVFFCNDAYRPTLGIKKSFLGASARKVWAEIWPDIGPRIERVLATGTATWDEGLLLFLERSGFLEETYHSFSYSPVYDDAGKVAGMLCVVSEDTERSIGERRLAALSALSSATLAAHSADEACELAANALAGDARDLPFALLYLLENEGRTARLAASAGLAAGSAASPERVALAEDSAIAAWAFEAVTRSASALEVEDVAVRHPGLVAGPWPEPVTRALVLPLARPGSDERPAGFLVAGASPRLPWDAGYRRFLDLVASRIGNAISDARAFAEEKQRAESLAELDRAKTVFFSNVSHELRTPLTLMLSPIDELLAGGGAPEGEAREQLQLAQRNGQRLLRLVNTLLDFSRIEAGRVQALYEPLDLAVLTAELASVFRSAMERAGLALVIDCPPLPRPVFVDRGMWEKIVLNLLSNAFKFTLEGEVRVSLRAEGGAAVLAISDTGTGIPEPALARLFERFYRVEGAKGRSIEGSGIGLALVQELARLHGGEVGASSRVGEGSRFEVAIPFGREHLPRAQVAAVPAARSAPLAPLDTQVYLEGQKEELRDTAWAALDAGDDVAWAAASETATALLQLTPVEGAPPAPDDEDDARPLVLVADDNADMRGYLARLLAGSHRVIVAADGEQALALARGARPDLVLSDVMMPRLDGFALLRALRQEPRTEDMPVILLSARAGEEARIGGLEAGADDYLTKPFQARELLARVSGTLALSRLRRERAEREAALRAETENVLESVTEGFVAIDAEWRVTYANSAGERLVQIDRSAMLGRTIWELFPELAGHVFEEPYRRAMRERVSVRVDARYEPLNAWLEVNCYPVAGGGLAFYFRDVLESRLMQEALRESDERNRFLIALDEALRALAEPEAIVATTTRMLAAQLRTDRCGYGEMEPDDAYIAVSGEQVAAGLPGLLGRHALADFGTAQLALLRAGQTQVIDDVEDDAEMGGAARAAYRAIGTRAHLGVPLLKGGRLVAALGLHQSCPRAWTPAEVELARIVIDRCWQAVLRARAEAALAASEREFRVLADAMPQIVYVSGADGGSEFINSQWQAYTGHAEAGPQDLAELIHADDLPVLQQRWAQAMAAGEPLMAEFRLRGRDGIYRWFLTRSLPSRDAAGRVVRWYGTSTDIDAQKRSQEALRASEERFRRLADSLPHIVFATEPEGRVAWVNRYASEFNGHPDGGLEGRHHRLIHPDDRERVRAAWRSALASGQPYEAELRLQRADGAWRWLLSRALALRDAEGRITEWIGGSVDIDDLRSAQQTLQQADRRKDEFLATLAHELRNPLAPLRNSVHLLRLSPSSETAARLEPMMRRQIDHLVRLVDDLLEVSRIGGGKIELRRAPVTLGAVLASAVETSRPLIEAGGHTLVQDFGHDKLVLDADAVRLAQVFANLLNNAAKYTDAGGRIELRARHEGRQAVVTVADNGTGIAPEMLPQLFELFMQIDRSAARAQGGLGIGLALVKSLVGLHGGSVEAASEGVGRGSVFTVRLPLDDAATAAADAAGHAPEAAALPAQQRVLVVDDNRDAAESLGVLLEFLGASVQIVHDGPAALAALPAHRPHVVLLDIGMPGMDGHEVARRMRVLPQGRALTLIALTGWGQAADRQRSKESGFDHHLVKPADIEELRGLLERVGQGSGAAA